MNALRPFYVIVFFLCLHLQTHAQLSPTFNYPNGYQACGKTILEIDIAHTGGTGAGPIIADFKLNTTLSFDSIWSSVENCVIVTTGNRVRFFFDTALTSGGSMKAMIRMKSTGSCSLVSCDQIVSLTDTLWLRYNARTDIYINKKNIQSPCLTYDETDFQNRLISSFIGDTIYRRLVLRNTGGGTFNGTVRFDDQFGEFIHVDTVHCTHASVVGSSVYTQLINDSTWRYQAMISNVPKGDSVVFVERVIVDQCIKEDEGKSLIYVSWGCDTNKCNKISPYPVIAQVLKDNKKPLVEIRTQQTASSNCLNSSSHYSYIVKNTGTRPAIDLRFEVAASDYNTYTYVDRTTLTLEDTTGLKLLSNNITAYHPIVPDEQGFEHTCTIAQPLRSWKFVFAELKPGDSLIVSFDTYNCCPGNDSTNVIYLFEAWGLTVDYRDQCRDNDYSANGSGIGDTELELQQFYEPRITDMTGGDVATFEILNYKFTSNFYRINRDSSAIKLVLKLDTGLVYVDNTFKISSLYGFDLIPDKIDTIIGAGVDGYHDSMIVATFILPDTFDINPGLFARYMRNSAVYFDLEAICPAKEPDSRFTQEFYFIPDLNCPSACEILLSTVTYAINVHCPGCIVPGWVGYSSTVQRITVGEVDDNNNRLPDFTAVTDADPDEIRFNRFLSGDTIRTEFSAYIQDGDPTLGKTKGQLENNGLESFEFKYNYLSTVASLGKLFDLNYVKVYIYDTDHMAIASGVDSIVLPPYSIQKFPAPNDSAFHAAFFYDLSHDTLYKYGITTAYKYDVYDHIKVVSVFSVKDPYEFFLNYPPDEEDPWLKLRNVPLFVTDFTNMMYWTGEKDVYGDSDVEAGSVAAIDPEELDSTMVYWCEGYGGVGSFVGRQIGENIVMAQNIFCSGGVHMSVVTNPAGGIMKNPFTNEYRQTIQFDSLIVTIPPGYTAQDWYYINGTERQNEYLEYDVCTGGDSNVVLHGTGNRIKILPSDYYDRFTQYGSGACDTDVYYGDEYNNMALSYTLVPECGLPAGVRIYAPPVMYYHTLPDNTYYEYTLEDPASVRYITPELKLAPVTNEVQLSKKDICYQINIEEAGNMDAPYSYLRIVSLRNKVKITSLTDMESGQVFHPDEDLIIHLGTFPGSTINKYDLCLTNLCGKYIERDTLLFVYGFDCDEYPDSSLANVCKKDTVMHILLPSAIGIQSSVDGPVELTMCQNFDVTYELQFTGIGKVSNLLMQYDTSGFAGVHYISGTMEYEGTTVSLSGSLDPQSLMLNMQNALTSLKPSGFGAGDYLKLILKFKTDCQFESGIIQSNFVVVTSICDTLYDDTLTYAPTAFIDFPQTEEKSFSFSTSELRNLGGNTRIQLRLHNEEAAPLSNSVKIKLKVPSGFTYTSMVNGPAPTTSGDTLIWNDVPMNTGVGNSRLFEFNMHYAPIEPCDSVQFSINIVDLVNSTCSSVVCELGSRDSSFKARVECYPCPPVLTIDDRCIGQPIYNTLTWTATNHSYCVNPDELYTLYFKGPSAQNFKVLLQTYDSSYVHENLSTYDGCYYVTVTNDFGNVSEPSNTVCNEMCLTELSCEDLFIPNLMTLNNDGLNDVFEIQNAYYDLELEVYSTWGKIVYKSDNYKNDWTGSGLVEGVYYYMVRIKDTETVCTGWVHLIDKEE